MLAACCFTFLLHEVDRRRENVLVSRIRVFHFLPAFFLKIICRHASLCACVHVSAALSVGSTCPLEVAVPCSNVAPPCSGMSNNPGGLSHDQADTPCDVGSERALCSTPCGRRASVLYDGEDG